MFSDGTPCSLIAWHSFCRFHQSWPCFQELPEAQGEFMRSLQAGFTIRHGLMGIQPHLQRMRSLKFFL